MTLARLRQMLRHIDYLVLLGTVALAVFGVMMIYAATNTGNTPRLASLYAGQRLYVITGVVLMIGFALTDYRFIARFYIPIYAACVLLLVIVLFIGKDATNTARWLWIPIPGYGELSIQPSEFTKIFIIISLAAFLDVRKEIFNHVLFLFIIFILIVLPVALIQLQPSLSASTVVAAVALVVLIIGGLHFRIIIAGLLLVVPAGLVVWFDITRAQPLFVTKILEPYQWTRIETFLNPVAGSEEYRQVQGSLFSIATGGLYGKGYGNNTYVINGYNDFIFSVVAEQFGFVGCAALMGLMGFIIAKCILIARRAFDLQGKLIAAGVAGMLLYETFANVCAVTALLPNTGMPFPLLSYGGSSMWVHMIAIGMVVNVGLPREKSMFDS